MNSGVTLKLQNIILTNGYGGNSSGGGIYNEGHLILDHTTIQNTTDSSYGGGAIATTGPLDISHSAFAHNVAGIGGDTGASPAPQEAKVTGNATLDINLGGFPSGTSTNANATGSFWAAPPRVAQAMPLGMGG